MKKLSDYIIVLEDVVPLGLCDAIVDEYADGDDWGAGEISDGLDVSVRNVNLVPMSAQSIMTKNLEVRKLLDRGIFESAGRAINHYAQLSDKLRISRDTGYDLLRYQTGQFYKEHVDFMAATPRNVSCSFALNDEYDGGEFTFFEGELSYRIPKGAALMFPSNFLFPHAVKPVTSGTRYSIVTWFI